MNPATDLQLKTADTVLSVSVDGKDEYCSVSGRSRWISVLTLSLDIKFMILFGFGFPHHLSFFVNNLTIVYFCEQCFQNIVFSQFEWT